MDNFLIDREALGQFVDALIKKKPLPVDNLEELNDLRERNITALDDKIGMAVFSQFTEEQNAEFNRMLDRENDPSEEEFLSFFEKAGINLKGTIESAMQEFANGFLGGQNV